MSASTRRGFLVLTGTGVAAAAAASVPAAAAQAASAPATLGASRRGPVVAYVRDTASGEICVMSGEREVVVHNRSLAALIARQIG
jgi:hypothetical protein